MIVTCDNCDTSFQLDDARVPEQGIRVRCSRCKEAFFLPNPSASASEKVDAVVSEAASAGGKVAPDATQDLPPGAQVQGDEDDWEFSVDPSQARESEGEQGGAFGGLAQGGDSGLALEGENASIGDDVLSTTDDEADDESDFGSVDDFSSLMEEDDLEQEGALEVDGGEAPVERPGIEEAKPNLANAGQYTTQGRSSEDLGEPENWDFFGDAAEEGGTAPSLVGRAGGEGEAIARVELAPRGSLPRAGSGIGALTDAWEADEDDDYDTEGATTGHVSRVIAWGAQGIGWAATVALVGLGLVSGFMGTAESLVTTPQSIEVGPLQAENVRAQWVDTSRGDTLLTVVGELHSRDARPVMAAGLVEVALLDLDRRPLELDAQPAGIPIREAELREAEPEALRITRDRAAWSLADSTIDQRIGTPFQAIFRGVPVEAAHVTLRIARESRRVPLPIDVDTLAVPGEPSAVSDSAEAPEAAESEPAAAQEAPAPTLPSELTWGE